MRTLLLGFFILGLATSCGGEEESNEFTDAREVAIDQRDSGCTPASFSIQMGEIVRLNIRNHTNVDYFLGVGEKGDRPSPLVVPPGQTKTTFYADPRDRSPDPLHCYTNDGVSTTIEVVREAS